jgi:hypothetical protein
MLVTQDPFETMRLQAALPDVKRHRESGIFDGVATQSTPTQLGQF